MTKRTLDLAPGRWRAWASLGAWMAMTFIAHDLVMTGIATHGHPRPGDSAFSSAEMPKMHGGDVSAESVHWAPNQHHAPVEAPPDRPCGVGRAAVRAVDDTLDATLHPMTPAIAPMNTWPSVVRSQVADAVGPSSRDWRTMLQVFLI